MNHLTTIVVAALMTATLSLSALAGNLDAPGTAGSNMPTTTDIYNRLDTGAAIPAPNASQFTEPSAGPTAGTGRTLAEIGAKLPVADNTNGAGAAEVLAGKTFWGLRTDGTWGVNTGTITSQGNVTGNNGSLSVPIPNGYYSGNKTATARDSNLTSGNIKSGASIFGVSGSPSVVDTSSATAAASNIAVGRTAYVNGAKVLGTYYPAIAKRVNKTGQTGCWDSAGTSISCAGTGQDGAYQYGVDPALTSITVGVIGAYNTPPYYGTRFIDNGNGTVTDALTALIWLKNANCFGLQDWSSALSSANSLASGSCGLTDGSTAGKWRLPNVNELHSLGPPWPPGSPFSSVQASTYWSSSSYVEVTDAAWSVFMDNGFLFPPNVKTSVKYVWPVRGGE